MDTYRRLSLGSQVSYSIVRVLAHRYKKGDKFVYDDMYIPCDKEKTIEDVTCEWSDESEHASEDSEFTEDVILLQFEAIGDWGDYPSDPLTYEAEMIGWGDVVSRYMDKLKAIADRKFIEVDKEPHEGGGKPNVVFLTLWEYSVSRDYEGEWDAEVSMLGEFDLEDITKILKVENSNA